MFADRAFPTVGLLRRFLALSLGLAAVTSAWGFSLTGAAWPFGTRIEMQLSLGPTAVGLQDGSGTWNNAAAAALEIWNQHLEAVQFAANQTSATSGSGGDGVNSVFFASNVFGDTFGANTLAVTVWRTDASAKTTEADVVFNRAQPFNSYRGPQQSSGGRAVYDLRRVAIHEFGHVLGLDHPDEHGQTVSAIMNSIISDIDTITADDIAGVKQLYGQTVGSNAPLYVAAGDQINGWSVSTNFTASSFTATGVPPGLQFDSATGVFSGRPTTKGDYTVNLTAVGPFRATSGSMRFVVTAPRITNGVGRLIIEVGRPFQFQVSATNDPTEFTATGLPRGLKLDTATGIISGVPTVFGRFAVKLTATGAPFGVATSTLSMLVEPPSISCQSPIAELGGAVSGQITASSRVTAFTVTGLPSGVQVDPTTGVISGVATLSGVFNVKVVAHTIYGDVASTLALRIQTPERARLQLAVNAMAADPVRHRMYLSDPYARSIHVLDTDTLAITHTVTGGNIGWAGLAVSRDGSHLWLAGASADGGTLIKVDLESFASSAPIPFGHSGCDKIREGLGGRLYVLESGDIMQVDSATGESSPVIRGSYFPIFEISPDGAALYVAFEHAFVTTLEKFDIHSSTPVLMQTTPQAGMPVGLAVSHKGDLISLATVDTNTGAVVTTLRAAQDLSSVTTSTNTGTGTYARSLTFSADDALLYAQAASAGSIEVRETKALTLTDKIVLPLDSPYTPALLAIDSSNSRLFETTSWYIAKPTLGVHDLKPPAPAASPAPPHSLLNVSTRLTSGTGDSTLIAGLIVAGEVPKKVLLRAIGPSLDIAGKMADPQLELHDATGKVVAANDNWNYNRAAVLATGAAPANERDAAIIATLQAGSYTAVLSGVGGTSGVAVVEMYDLDAAHSHIANISTRGRVGVADNVMIGGFILGGDQSTNVLVRAIGPSLREAGITGALADTMLELHDGNGAIVAQNDDWRSNQQQAISATGAAPTDDRESAIVAAVAPGAYTAVVRGKNNTAGIGLVEVYNLTP